MKKTRSKTIWLPAACLAALPVLAQSSAQDFRLQEPKTDSLNRISVGYRMSFNLNVDFKNVGGFVAPHNPGPATGGAVDRTYADGFNKVDITGNNHGPGFENTTWNWGYSHSTQIVPNPANPQAVVMHSYSSPGATVANRDDDPAPGVEVTYFRQLLNKKSWRLGLEGAFAYTDLTVNDSGPAGATISQLSDGYAVPPDLTGQPLPPPGYQGTRAGIPGGSNPVISSFPSRSIAPLAGTVNGFHNFGSDLFNFRLGPCIEVPLSQKIAVNVSGGFALVYAHSDFNYRETLSGPGIGTLSYAGNNAHSDVLPGGYVAAGISAEFTKGWAAFVGAQFENVGTYTHNSSADNRQVVLDLSRAVFVTFGVSYSF
jgi:hypothetical protein